MDINLSETDKNEWATNYDISRQDVQKPTNQIPTNRPFYCPDWLGVLATAVVWTRSKGAPATLPALRNAPPPPPELWRINPWVTLRHDSWSDLKMTSFHLKHETLSKGKFQLWAFEYCISLSRKLDVKNVSLPLVPLKRLKYVNCWLW